MLEALNRLAKWRAHFAGWQLGTRTLGDPECDAVRDTQERLLILRAEVTALSRVLVEAGLTTPERFAKIIDEEAEEYMKLLEKRWPGVKARDYGLDYDAEKITPWMKKWKP